MKRKILVLCLCLVLSTGCKKEIPKLKNGEEAVVTINITLPGASGSPGFPPEKCVT